MDERDSTRPPSADVQASDVHRTPSGAYRAGHRLGKYVLEGTLGRGGMGLVYRARHVDLDRVVALKVLLPGPDLHADDIARFVREAKLLASLRHPNIVPLHDFDQAEGVHFYTMDLVEGEDLGDRLSRGPIPVKRALEILRDAARGVAHAHEQGVIHRDLKPGNILLGKDGRVFVTDFGLAKRVDAGKELTASGTMMGTPAYMSPEQAAGETGRIDGRSDVYGLGAVMFHALTGRLPFDGPGLYEILCRVIEAEPAMPSSLRPGLPRDAEVICLKCLEKEPARRYAGAGELADDLDRFLRGDPIRARATGPASRAWRWLRKRPLVAGAAVLVLTAVGVTGGVSSRRYGRQLEVARLAAEAKYAFGMNDLGRASRCADEAVRVAPHHAAGYFWRARLRLHEYLRTRRLPEVVLSDGLVEFGPPVPETEDEVARRTAALEELGRMKALARDGLEGWEEPCALGIAACLSGRFGEAEPLLRRALEAGPDLQAQYALALVHYHRRKFEASALAARRLLLSPMDEAGRALFVQARAAEALAVELRAGDPAGALDEAQREAAKLAPPLDSLLESAVRRQRALWWTSRGRADAGPEFVRAVECAARAPESADRAEAEGAARVAYGEWLENHGRRVDGYREHAKAADMLRRAVESHPDRVGLRLKAVVALRRMASIMDRYGRTAERDAAMKFATEEASRALEAGPYLEAHAALLMFVRLPEVRPPTSDELLNAMESRVSQVRAIVAASPDSARAWFVLAQLVTRWAIERRDRGRPAEEPFEEALAAYGRALTLHPHYRECLRFRTDAMFSLCDLRDRRGVEVLPDLRACEHDLERQLESGTDDPRGWTHLAMVRSRIAELHWSRGEDGMPANARAEEAFEQCFRLDAEAAYARVARAALRSNAGLWRMQAGQDPEPDFRRALEDLDVALRIDPGESTALTNRGMLQLTWAVHDLRAGRDAQPRYRAAIADFRLAIREDTLNTRAMVELARTEYNLGVTTGGFEAAAHLRAAIDEAERALKRDSGLADAWGVAGQAWGALGAMRRDARQDASDELRRSAECAGRALAINPVHAKALRTRSVALINLALREMEAGRDPSSHFEAARRDLEAALERNPKAIEALESRANLRLNLAIWAESRGKDPKPDALASAADYTAYLDARAQDLAARYWRGEAWRRAGRWRAAREDFEAVAASGSPWRESARKRAEECKARE